MRRNVAIEVFAPVAGVHQELGESFITLESTPNCAEANAFYGFVQKDYGTSVFSTGTFGAPCSLLYEAKFVGETTLQVLNHTGMYKYTSGGDTFVNDGQTYAGTFTDVWSGCMHNDAFIYSNGVDLLQYKASYSATGTEMGGVTSGSYKAWCVASFKEHLNLYHTVEAGNICAKRVRWSKVGLLSYASADWSGGTSGFVDLQDADGDIMAAAPLGNGAMAIYSEDSIHVQEWVGGTDVYRFTKAIQGVGVPSRRGVVAMDAVNYVLARNNVYEYWGGRDLRAIGDPIKKHLVANFNTSAGSYAFLSYQEDDDELRVHIPAGTSTQPSICYICKVKENYSWFVDNRQHTAAGRSSRANGLKIGDLVGSIAAQTWKFGDQYIAAGAPVFLYGDPSGRLVKKDKTRFSVTATATTGAQSFVFDTKDITSIRDIDPLIRDRYHLTQYMDNQNRWLSLKVEAKGTGSLYCLYSTDAGTNFTTFNESPIILTSTWQMHQLDIDRASERFMVRFVNTGTDEVPYIRYWKVQFVAGAEEQR